MLKTQRQQATFWRTLSYLFLTLLSALMIFPFVWMLVTSFKPFAEIFSGATFFPSEWTLSAYRSLFAQNDALLKIWNSFYIAASRTVLSVFLCALGGYAFAKFRFPGRNVLFMSMIGSMTIPFAVLLVPLFIIMRNYGWIDTAWPLIIPFAANAFGIFFHAPVHAFRKRRYVGRGPYRRCIRTRYLCAGGAADDATRSGKLGHHLLYAVVERLFVAPGGAALT